MNNLAVKLPPFRHPARVIDHGDADEDIRPEQLRGKFIGGPVGHERSIGTTARS